MGSVRTRMLADTEQSGRHRIDSGPAASIGYRQSQVICDMASAVSADGQDDRADAHELLRQPQEPDHHRRLTSGA